MLGVLRSASRLSALAAAPAISAGMLGSYVRCHCQVPCGIFDDPMRVKIIKEDAATIRKAMVQINELAPQSSPLALNQARPAGRLCQPSATRHADRAPTAVTGSHDPCPGKAVRQSQACGAQPQPIFYCSTHP
jgi:hypothetical protein